VLKKVTKCRVPSNEASKTTVRNRSQQLEKELAEVSSPDANRDAALYQLAALLKTASQEEISKLMADWGLFKIRIPAGHELAMKARMGWSWNEMRKLKR
jgi:hypothetical protein